MNREFTRIPQSATLRLHVGAEWYSAHPTGSRRGLLVDRYTTSHDKKPRAEARGPQKPLAEATAMPRAITIRPFAHIRR